jgi:hypothetical protein
MLRGPPSPPLSNPLFPTLHSPSQLPLSLLQVLHIILIYHAISSQPSDSYRYIYFHPSSTSSLDKELFFYQLLYLESIEWFTEDQAFSRSYDSTPCPMPTPLISLSRQYAWPATHRKTDNERHFADGKGGRARSRIIKPQESLALYKSFNTLCLYPY